MKQTHPLKLIPFIIIGLLIIAIAHLPYGYYTFLRIVVFSYTGILAYNYISNQEYNRGLIFATIGIIYNPIFPIHLTKSIRIAINLLAAITITTYLITQNEKRKTLKQKLNKASKEQEKIDQFFEENSNAKKELDDEIKLWQTKPKKSNPNAKRVRCATPHVRRVKEKIYDKYNK